MIYHIWAVIASVLYSYLRKMLSGTCSHLLSIGRCRTFLPEPNIGQQYFIESFLDYQGILLFFISDKVIAK